MTPGRQLWTWIGLNLAVWLVAFGVAEFTALGQDPAGAGMYGGMAFIGTIVLLGLPISVRVVRLLRARRDQVTGAQRAVGLLSVALVLLVTIPMLGLLFVEGYWWLALLLGVGLYVGFFGSRPPGASKSAD